MNAHQSLAEMKSPAPREASMPAVTPGFGSLQSFELAIRQAKLLSSSTLVPAQYRGVIEKKKGGNITYEQNDNAIPNCVIAMNMASRMGADPLMVMQNLYIVEGRPSWSSQWIIAAINGCGRFSPLRFELKDNGKKEVEHTVTEWVDNNRQNRKVKDTIQNLSCVAWAVEKETGERITSPTVTIEMAVKEGWYQKNGSKWQTMPEVMLRYRTASFFGKLYAPELLMGLQTVEEMQDVVIDATPDGRGGYSVELDELKEGPAAGPSTSAPNVDTSTGEIIDTHPSVTGDSDDAAMRQIEQQTQQSGGFNPTAEEIAAIHDREMAEAQQSAPSSRQRRERGQNGLGIE
jgi:hypothetical protein